MSAERNFTDQDYELLSAYLDGALAEAERSALETRLQSDDRLRQELAALQQTVNLVRGLPPLKAPRNFTLTPSMVRPRSTRWLIFPTSAAFSAISAAAATVLILLGAGILLLQSNSAGAPTSGAHFVAEERSTSQIASLPTEIPPVSEKTAERDQRTADETTAAVTSVSVPPSPTAIANGAALPENSAASELQPPQVTNEEQAAPVTSDGTGYTTQLGSSQGGETGQGQVAQAPADSTLLYAATLAPPSVQPLAPGVADMAAETGTSTLGDSNAQSNTPAEITLDLLQMTATEAQFGADNQDAFALLTATMPIVEQFAASPSGTPMPSPTLRPTVTATASPTPAPSATPFPTQTLPASSPPSVPNDLLIGGTLIIGILLLAIAVITTIIRRRG
jgi:anti-sigma factor RsiW